jgi:hypothetical protein
MAVGRGLAIPSAGSTVNPVTERTPTRATEAM